MKQATYKFTVATSGRGLQSVNREIVGWAEDQVISTGLLTVFIPHTSASLVIQENADPDVMHDLNAFFNRMVKDGDPAFLHTCEGPDDMASHIRSALTQTHLSIPVAHGKLTLGMWQGIYLFEHRTSPHQRSIILHLIGE
ncbi:MAG: secondary thiamine-phosphate synthase enzyme YjbQ [Nitrospinales bacterium]